MRVCLKLLRVLLLLNFLLTADAFAEPKPYILFDKGTHLFLIKKDDTVLFKTLAGYGLAGYLPKETKGDLLTPEGAYEILHLRSSKQYLYFAEIDYPNLNDLALAYYRRRISQEELLSYFLNNGSKGSIKETLGKDLGIHGGGSFRMEKNVANFNWTQGCIALDNDDLKEVLPYLKPGTRVYIFDSSKSLFEFLQKFVCPKTVKPLAFFEGGLYLRGKRGKTFVFRLRFSVEGLRELIFEEWSGSELLRRMASRSDGKFANGVEAELKRLLIENIHTLEDLCRERAIESWK